MHGTPFDQKYDQQQIHENVQIQKSYDADL